MNTLKEIFNKHKCDKGTRRHRYDRVYEPALEHFRNEKFNMLEVGILNGESLNAHLEYFPKATLYAIDIFGRVPAKDVPVLENEQVNWCNCDSIKGPNNAFKEMIGDVEFDVIIDDGLHTHDSQRLTFENLIPYLKDGGTYFIEDVWQYDRMDNQQRKHQWLTRHKNDYSEEQYNALLEAIKPYTVTFHDLRDGFHPDTFIIEIVK